jgi:hypothetical protein
MFGGWTSPRATSCRLLVRVLPRRSGSAGQVVLRSRGGGLGAGTVSYGRRMKNIRRIRRGRRATGPPVSLHRKFRAADVLASGAGKFAGQTGRPLSTGRTISHVCKDLIKTPIIARKNRPLTLLALRQPPKSATSGGRLLAVATCRSRLGVTHRSRRRRLSRQTVRRMYPDRGRRTRKGNNSLRTRLAGRAAKPESTPPGARVRAGTPRRARPAVVQGNESKPAVVTLPADGAGRRRRTGRGPRGRRVRARRCR